MGRIDSRRRPCNDAVLHDFDDSGLGLEPGNLAAINSLKLYRKLRWGRHVDLILTDNRSFRAEPWRTARNSRRSNRKDFLKALPRMYSKFSMPAALTMADIRPRPSNSAG